MHATFSPGGSCACAAGTISLSYAGFSSLHNANHWLGTGPFGCGHNITVDFYCNAVTSFIIFQYPDGCGVNSITGGNPGAVCNPFSDAFVLSTGVSLCGSCFGAFGCTITL